jgi:hypothetical protein
VKFKVEKTILEAKSKRLAFFDKLDAEEPRQYLKQHEKLTKVSDQVFYLDNADKFTDKEYFKVSNTNLGVGYVLAEGTIPVSTKLHGRRVQGDL